MADKAAIVTGGSSGIGLALARMLGEEGYGITLTARRPQKLQAAATELAGAGCDVQHLAGDIGSEETVASVVAIHQDKFKRLDVLVNNAGIGIGAPLQEIETKHLDLQISVNLRSMVLLYRQCAEMLKAAGAEHRNALVVNTASIAGRSGQGQPWLSVYSATKHGVVGFTEAMNKELASYGVKSCALCPGFVDTAMTGFVKQRVPADEMIQPADIAEAVRMLLRVSPACVIPEIVFQRVGAVL